MTKEEINQFPEQYLDRRLDYELEKRGIHITHRWGWAAVGEIIQAMHERGFWCELKSPFFSGQPWFAGFTPHNCTGWNGRPDHQMDGKSGPLAVAKAAVLALAKEEKDKRAQSQPSVQPDEPVNCTYMWE